MKKYFWIVVVFILGQVHAQTGIGTTTPNASAKLDVYATNKGFLPPRVTLTSVTDATTIASPAEGLLVYNLGSVGLQAGYYYWNNANWATIATATSAGNGVTASDLVKIYDGLGNTATINTNGVPFSVTTSGKYLFDFSTSATCGGCTLTLNFQVRDGANSNAVIASDMQTSYSNNVHSEYNGKVEANLIAGRSYNVLVTASSGGIYNNDYTRVYMKQVSGNLPVTGQTVDYVSVGSIYQTAIGDNRDLIFTNKIGGNIPYNTTTGVFTLSANKTYLLQAQVRANTPSVSSSYIEYGFVDATTNALLVNGTETITSSTTATGGYGSNPVINFIYTPSTNQTVKLRTTVNTNGTQTIVSGTANITQIGSSAIINPWTLSGTNTYNTTGNVGIGNNAPTQALDVTGNANVTGKINLSDPSGNVAVKAASFVNENIPVILGDIQVQMAPSGLARSLQIKTTGTAFTGMVTAYTSYNGASGTNAFTNFSDITQTINSTFAHLGTTWGFAQSGDVANYFLRDTTNQRFWRITLMVGASFNNNFIIIERLL